VVKLHVYHGMDVLAKTYAGKMGRKRVVFLPSFVWQADPTPVLQVKRKSRTVSSERLEERRDSNPLTPRMQR